MPALISQRGLGRYITQKVKNVGFLAGRLSCCKHLHLVFAEPRSIVNTEGRRFIYDVVYDVTQVIKGTWE